MRIAQVVLPDASEYERKSQRIDRAALSGKHEVVVVSLDDLRAAGAQVAHIYASQTVRACIPVPFVSSAEVRKPWTIRRCSAGLRPAFSELPEAVEDFYFEAEGRPEAHTTRKIIGSFRRASVQPLIDQTLHRLQRTRDDIEWKVFEKPPAPVDLSTVDIWVDPAVSETDFDGFVAEALVAGLPVVATRTKINDHRLEKGRTGLLVPTGDPNELTHAILSALFRPEVASNKKTAARQTATKFRARQRLRVLVHMYESISR